MGPAEAWGRVHLRGMCHPVQPATPECNRACLDNNCMHCCCDHEGARTLVWVPTDIGNAQRNAVTAGHFDLHGLCTAIDRAALDPIRR
jgi:hypothetical protein